MVMRAAPARERPWEWYVLIAAFVASAICPPMTPLFFLGSTVCAAVRHASGVRMVSLVLTGVSLIVLVLMLSLSVPA